jgi:hypothetical protein
MTLLCKCGCGGEFTPSRNTLWRIKKGVPTAGYIPRHHSRGRNNGHWKGGRFVSAEGYVYLLRPDHPNALKHGTPGYVAEHRLVMSEHLGRPLLTSELVHHINGNKADNAIENLVVISRPAHAREHHSGSTNVNWTGGRTPLVCETCSRSFLPKDRRNDYGAKYCSRDCFNNRHRYPRRNANS